MAAVVREQQRIRLALGVTAVARPVEKARHCRAGRSADDLGVDDTALGLCEDLGLTNLDSRLR